MNRLFLGLFLGTSAWLMASPCRAQDSLERGLLKQAPEVIKYVQKQGCKNVGVLKFLVSREGKPFTDNVGTLNLLVARRLELAMILANEAASPIGIIHNASAVAHTIAGSNHLSKEGREKLFTGKYPLAWGKETVQADAFITGTIEIGKDLRKLTVTLFCFDKAANKLAQIGADFQVKNTSDRLAEMGESFVTRGGDDAEPEAQKQEKALTEAVKVRDQVTKNPAQLADPPVTLDVVYDGVKVPLEFREGKALVPEPKEGQKVELHLRRDGTKERYAVVLKVNGENTLDRQRLPDLSCRKWVLGPGEGPYGIVGFQVGNEAIDLFRVASVGESQQREVNYGADVGTITMTVFREQKGPAPKPKLIDEAALNETVVKKVVDLAEAPKNYSALKAQLLEDANRGLLVEGERKDSKIAIALIEPDPSPIMALTIVYYNPRGNTPSPANGTVDKFGAPKSPDDPGPGAPPL